MTCPECGSSVVDADAFCPFCGIRLEAQVAVATPAEDPLESTIMMSPSEAEELARMSAANAGQEGANDPQAQGSVESEDPADRDAGGPGPVTSGTESESADPAFDNVPVPSILADLGKTGGNLAPSSTSEFSADELAEPVEQGAAPELTAPEPVYEHPVEIVDAVPEEEYPAGIAAGVSPALPDTAPDIDLSTDQDPAESFPEAEPPAPAVLQENHGVDAAGSHDTLPEPSPSGTDAGVIGKPADDLSSFDSYQSRSMFDSVRIMEPRIADRADDVDTRLHPASRNLPEVRVDSAAASGSVDEGNAEKAISSTSHNIGLGDTDGKKSAKLKPLSEGTILNSRYEIIRKIGGGGMGAVYLASDNNLGGVLRAVKEMVQTHIEEEQQEKAINDFKRESMILSSLDHVSIPTIYDYFYDEKEGRFYLVMKYISGGDLSSRLRSAQEGRIDERTVCEWALQITDVLDYLHNQPSTIVYRDLKPSNIMIDGNSGRAMLIDFGIARSISQKEEKGVTAVGTMGYAPPELFSGNVEPRSDIYSLGSTMFHLLTGADPQSNPLLIFDFQKNPRPRQINPQLSDQIERLIMKAVQYSADQRFASAADMRGALEDHLVKFKAGIVTYGVSEVPASVSLSNQSVFCGFCGQRIVATDMFCAFCGAKQPIAQQGVHSEIYSEAGWTAKLVVEGTSELTAPAFSLQKDENLLGRRDPMSNIFPEVDLSKYDPQTKISRRHARIWREGGNFLLEDLGSSNGTILTRSASDSLRLVPKQPQVLAAGDRIRLGDATLHFIIG